MIICMAYFYRLYFLIVWPITIALKKDSDREKKHLYVNNEGDNPNRNKRGSILLSHFLKDSDKEWRDENRSKEINANADAKRKRLIKIQKLSQFLKG